jgi:hypothetical protein
MSEVFFPTRSAAIRSGATPSVEAAEKVGGRP